MIEEDTMNPNFSGAIVAERMQALQSEADASRRARQARRHRRALAAAQPLAGLTSAAMYQAEPRRLLIGTAPLSGGRAGWAPERLLVDWPVGGVTSRRGIRGGRNA
jgi:hypothetical protein